MNKPILAILLCCLGIILLTSGIIRHDVDEQDYLDLGAQEQFDAVGLVYVNGIATGSCVLINSQHALSAAHVFMSGTQRMQASEITLKFNDAVHGIRKIIFHPAFLDPKSKGSCDIVILQLEEPVQEVEPAYVNKMTDELHADVTGVGYGVSGIASQPESVTPMQKKIAGQNVVDSIGGYAYIGNHSLLMSDFDHPVNTTCNKMGSAAPRPLEYVCGGGDSGGGLFRYNQGRWELIGICVSANTNIETLLSTGYYGQVMYWTRVSVFDNWITSNSRQ